MVFGKRSLPESNLNGPDTSKGLILNPKISILIIGIVCGCMVAAYLLGFRAGHTNGLELALANSVSQVVRSPVAKASAEASDFNISDSSDVYAKLKEPVAGKENANKEPVEVSKEVKDFLKPTPTVLAKNSAKEEVGKSTIESAAVIATNEKKQADTLAIEKALLEAKEIDKPVELAKQDDSAVRVIGGVADTLDVIDEPAKKKLETVKSIPLGKPQVAVEKNTGKQAVSLDGKKLETKEASIAKLPNADISLQKKEVFSGSQNLPAGWYSQVAAPRSLNEAQALASKLKSAGFKSRIETAQVREERYFRVVVGPESNRTVADQVLARLKKQGIVKSEPFIRMVR